MVREQIDRVACKMVGSLKRVALELRRRGNGEDNLSFMAAKIRLVLDGYDS